MTLVKSDIESLINSLNSLDAKCLFGCMDQEILLSKDTNIRYVQMQHEQAAVHAADGFARATGRPGVVFLTTASGITNSITGIATAYSDSVPLVIITMQIEDQPLHTNHEAFQELNISGLTMAIIKHTLKVNPNESIQEALKHAINIAADGRPGPVLLELTTDTTLNEPKNHRFVQIKARKQSQENSIEMAKRLIEKARKPVIFVGGGVIASGGADYLREVVKLTRIPVVSSLMGIGSMEAGNPLYLGMLGMHGTFAANKAVHHCDLLISIGVRFSDRVTGRISGFSPTSKKIHVDIDPAEINKIIPVDLPIVSDAKEFLFKLKNQLDVKKLIKMQEVGPVKS
ncbi:thiamine pyrophosphate-binding protein [Bacillus sp. X1(2014)]|uniref:thiamine pyrophosphate-binding protein n=1 Tax=Bacillus sp. X1(2014) TaxID=1565991 RepID=UPI0021B2B84A|nr:thiamine pyrophosphate-binding protein [Bacillus sp. X1(2014)]